MKLNIAFLMNDKEYMEKITQGLSCKYIEELNISMYVDKNTAIDDIKKNPVDVIIADENYTFNNSPIEDKYILIYMTEDKKDNVNNHKAIFKYQKITDIYNSIVNIFHENREKYNDINTCVNKEAEDSRIQGNSTAAVACIVSAAGGTGNTAIAISAANNMVIQNKKTLYINAEKFESCEMYIDDYNGIVYKNIIGSIKERDNKKIIDIFNDTVVKSSTGMNIYALHDDVKDIDALNGPDIVYFLDVIRSMDIYDYIVLDFKMSEIQNSREILKNVDDIIMISDGSDIVNFKTDRAVKLLRYYDEIENDNVIEKVKILYNRFVNNKSNTLQYSDIQTVGGVPFFEDCNNKEIIMKITRMEIMKSII